MSYSIERPIYVDVDVDGNVDEFQSDRDNLFVERNSESVIFVCISSSLMICLKIIFSFNTEGHLSFNCCFFNKFKFPFVFYFF